MQLAHSRILVVDDQVDVARTLCKTLQRAGATLHFTPDGESALEKMAAAPFDLVLVDMKMPPGDWGGLWLLRAMGTAGWRMPALVLSGEGTQRQTIEALRLGAADWVDKTRADAELNDRVEAVLSNALENGVDTASLQLPSIIAGRLLKYGRAADPAHQAVEGLHTLELILRFTAILGLSSAQPGRLGGVSAGQLCKPSLGTWWNICTALADRQGTTAVAFRELHSWIAPDKGARQKIQQLIAARNAWAHNGQPLGPKDRSQLTSVLRHFGHRAATCWRHDLVIPTSLGFDDKSYRVAALSLAGHALPTAVEFDSATPINTSGVAYLAESGGRLIPLAPWVLIEPTHKERRYDCLVFDVVKTRNTGAPDPDAEISYTNLDEHIRDVRPASSAAPTWAKIAAWAS